MEDTGQAAKEEVDNMVETMSTETKRDVMMFVPAWAMIVDSKKRERKDDGLI